jgi:hypothetical protein
MKKLFLVISLASISIIACKKDDDTPDNPTPPANESEIITTVKLLLTDSNGNQVSATWRDLDGTGPQQPIIGNLNLKKQQYYMGKVLLLDETKMPVDTISNEVADEAEAHQFFYSFTGTASSNTTLTRIGVDANNLPVGMNFSLITADTSNGSLTIVLKHYDGIAKSTDPTIGETDVQVTFPLSILP